MDVTEYRDQSDSLEESLRFEKLLAELSSRFIDTDPEEIVGQIGHAVAAAGDLLGADRCVFFLLGEDGEHHHIAELWRRDWIAHDPEVQGRIVQQDFPWLVRKMNLHEDIVICGIDDLPAEAVPERKYCEDRGIQSFLMCPMFSRDVVVGNLGLDMIGASRNWTDVDLRRLRLLGEIVASALLRARKDQEIRELQARLQAENIYLKDRTLGDPGQE